MYILWTKTKKIKHWKLNRFQSIENRLTQTYALCIFKQLYYCLLTICFVLLAFQHWTNIIKSLSGIWWNEAKFLKLFFFLCVFLLYCWFAHFCGCSSHWVYHLYTYIYVLKCKVHYNSWGLHANIFSPGFKEWWN